MANDRSWAARIRTAPMRTVPSRSARLALALACGGAAALAVTPAVADEFEQHAAHEHGKAQLDVAVDGGRVELRLDTPAANVLGFERPPRTPQERQAIATAAATLGARAFAFPVAAKCATGTAELQAPAWAKDAKTGTAAGARAADAKRDHDHDHAHDGDREHADYEARWTYTCAVPAALSFVDATFVGALQPGTVVQANVITDALQTRQDLRSGAVRVRLK
jgi:hypothetical protein